MIIFLEKMDDFWESNPTKPDFIWKSIGLYAKAGEIVEIEVKTEILNIIKVSQTNLIGL